MTDYEPIIGLEVHAELLTESKMFCGCAVVDSTEAEPNSAVCEICTGMPGTLPVLNQRAVEFAIRVGLALNCSIAETSVFARKNYFYPDLPKGFQISQYELPLATDGWLDLDSDTRVGIRRVHLEEDTGKLIHDQDHSLVDYNRSGVPLLEIVSEPDIHSAEDARRYAMALRSVLRYLQVNSGDLEKGVIRFEANVSVRRAGAELGTRTEIKNLNSIRSLGRAVEFEIQRQSDVLDAGGTIHQDTLGWDEARQVTVSQRSKEEAHDYRYFPEPDLPPLHIDPAWIEQIRKGLPELPAAKRDRLVQAHGLSPAIAALLVADAAVADFFEAAVRAGRSSAPAKIANWLTGELFGLLNESGTDLASTQLTPEALAELVDLVETGQISRTSGKQLLAEIHQSGGSPRQMVEQKGLLQLSDAGAILPLVEEVLNSSPEQVNEYLSGKTTLLEWFVGQVMRLSRGRAEAGLVRSALETALAEKSRTPE